MAAGLGVLRDRKKKGDKYVMNDDVESLIWFHHPDYHKWKEAKP
jgi:hypothetical protein